MVRLPRAAVSRPACLGVSATTATYDSSNSRMLTNAGVVVLITIVVWLGMKVRNVRQAIPLASVDTSPLSADTSLPPARPLAKKNENAAAGDDRGAAPRPHIGHLPEHDDA
jgi:hypothetical protein